ncbi:hypothetical protein [Verrucosispora sp. WMMC514]|uniref:hypothetical protein n=1 Tax=Verrucosispora sp. WMMC514 TaxID=3015156 RepID=UPI00248C092B|nr:hypothetical protein [Verrucosispora sp. WMMC514]WBB94185.1 hypothetical protein O7597_15150 [Verrucosispora sp. WMMC514]
MRPKADYIAKRAIFTNGVRAYNPGDDVPESAVENLFLSVGEDVLPADPEVIPRPAGNAKRAEWVAYWLGQGMDPAEVDEMTRDELAAKEPEVVGEPEPAPAVPYPAPDNTAEQAAPQLDRDVPVERVERPGRDGRKPEWVEYAVYRGMPRETAEESTIPQLAGTDYDLLFGPPPVPEE